MTTLPSPNRTAGAGVQVELCQARGKATVANGLVRATAPVEGWSSYRPSIRAKARMAFGCRTRHRSSLCDARNAAIELAVVLRNDEPAIETFVSRGFRDLNNNDATTYWSKDYGESPFDRIFLAEGRPEFKYSRQYVLRSSDLTQHDRFLSDHYMIKVSVKDYVDDADPR